MGYEKLKSRDDLDAFKETTKDNVFNMNLLERYENRETIFDEKTETILNAYGKPIERSEMVVCYQGINDKKYLGTCGIVSCVNVINICEKNRLFEKRVLEKDLVNYAVEHDLCDTYHKSAYDNGATTALGISEILKGQGIDNTVLENNRLPDFSELGEIVKSGDVAIIGVNAADFYENATTRLPFFRNRRHANHAVTLTGAVYEQNEDSQHEVIRGFYFADSGRGLYTDKARFVDLNQLNQSYSNKINAVCIVAHIKELEKLN